jgi:septal ring factor EnvC (AmiA/AmiB activator)
MRQTLIDRTTGYRAPALAMLCAMAVGGCVSTETYTKTLAELEAVKKTAAQQAADLEALKKKSQAQTDQLKQQLAGLQQNLDQEATAERKPAEQQAASLAKERETLAARSGTSRQGGRDQMADADTGRAIQIAARRNFQGQYHHTTSS